MTDVLNDPAETVKPIVDTAKDATGEKSWTDKAQDYFDVAVDKSVDAFGKTVETVKGYPVASAAIASGVAAAVAGTVAGTVYGSKRAGGAKTKSARKK